VARCIEEYKEEYASFYCPVPGNLRIWWICKVREDSGKDEWCYYEPWV